MKNLVETKKLSLDIANKKICHDLDIEIKPGEIVGVIGPNGSGKTTLLKTLSGLLSAQSGEVLLAGKKLAALSKKTIAQNLGILFQDTEDTFSQTVFEFCSGGRYPHLNYFAWENKADHGIVEQALQVMGLLNQATQKIQTLSGGERRRLAIATLLTQAPMVYVLDEPTNHLDLHFQITVLNYFKTLAKQHSVAVIMSLHDINLAAHYCHSILMLCGDGVVLQGAPTVIFSKENLERIYQCPFQSVMSGERQLWVPYYREDSIDDSCIN